MNDCTKLGRISRRVALRSWLGAIYIGVMLGLAGCGLLPLPDNLPVDPARIQELHGVPRNLDEARDLMRDMGLPDLSRLADVPGLEALPQMSTQPGTIVYQGPIDQSLEPGTTVPGADIELVDVNDDVAVFRIDGMRAERRIGDSLDFDGAWPQLNGVTYALRLRIYRVANGQVRAAGVHRLTIADVTPQEAPVDLSSDVLLFPYTVAAAADERFPGLTYGFSGEDARGAVLTGLAGEEYPYRKIGDSITWQGYVRADLPVEYQLRMLYYQDDNARVGGVVSISLPGL